MAIPARGSSKNFDYEKVKIDDWINGQIVDVEWRKDYEQTFTDKKTGEKKIKKVNQVRFKFELEGYDHPHNSRWNTLSTNKKANLYKKYIVSLFGNKYEPDTDLDMQKLKGVLVKTMWDQIIMKDGTPFQFVDKIRLLNSDDVNKIDMILDEHEEPSEQHGVDEEDIPF